MQGSVEFADGGAGEALEGHCVAARRLPVRRLARAARLMNHVVHTRRPVDVHQDLSVLMRRVGLERVDKVDAERTPSKELRWPEGQLRSRFSMS
jgi:hypothetical protein